MHKQKYSPGVTLIELMISLTLGLVIMAVVINIFISQKSSYTLQENMSHVQENGRFVLDFLSRDIRMAGRPDETQVPIIPIAQPFLPYDSSDIRTNASETDLSGAGIAGDRLSFSYFAVDGSNEEDCLGNRARTDLAARVPITNTYYVDDTNNQLMCAGITEANTNTDTSNGGAAYVAPAVIAEDIEMMQVQYGEDTDAAADGVANIYVSADNVTDWSDIVSVRIAILVASPAATPTFDPNTTFKLLDAAPFTAGSLTGRQLRRAFSTTIMARNIQGAIAK